MYLKAVRGPKHLAFAWEVGGTRAAPSTWIIDSDFTRHFCNTVA
jgi:hypothetical protein